MDVILLADVVAAGTIDTAAKPAACVAEGIIPLFSVVPFGKGFPSDVFRVILGATAD